MLRGNRQFIRSILMLARGEVRAIALTRKVQQHDVLSWFGAADQRRTLLIAEMAFAAHDSRFQERRTIRCGLHFRAVVRFDGEKIRTAEMVDERSSQSAHIRGESRNGAGVFESKRRDAFVIVSHQRGEEPRLPHRCFIRAERIDLAIAKA